MGLNSFRPLERLSTSTGMPGLGRVRIIGERGPLRVKVHAFGGRWA